MKRVLAFMILITFITINMVFGWAAEAVKDGVRIYKNKTRKLNEKPIYELRAGEVVEVLKSSGDKYYVKHYSGVKGWVEKRLLRKAKDIGKTMAFTGEQVLGELGDIEPVIIFEDEDNKLKGVKIERSFKDEMKANVDKEQMEREFTNYINW